MTVDSNNQNQFESDDLDWLAFCYIADELDAAGRLQFEARLSDDQKAREAVASAVEQAMRIDRAAANSPSMPVVVAVDRSAVRRWSMRPAWVAAAALLTFAIAGYWLLPVENFRSTAELSSESSEDELADAWVNALVSLEQDEFEDAVADEYEVNSLEKPGDSWMFVALVEMDDDDETDLPEGHAKIGEGGPPCLE